MLSACAPLSGDLKPFDGTDYKYPPSQFLNAVQAHATYQLGPEPSHPAYQQQWHIRRMALVATALTGPAATWFNGLSETTKATWSTFTAAFLKQFDTVTAQFRAQAEAQTIKFKPEDSISIYACKIEDLVNKGWPEFDAKMRNREYVNVFIQGLPYDLKRIANGKKLEHTPTVDSPIINFQVLKDYINRKHLAQEMTPKDPNPIFSVQNTYTDSYRNRNYQSHRSRSPYNKHDPNNKESSQFNKFCSYCRKNGHSISRCFKRQMNKYRESNEKSAPKLSNSKTTTKYSEIIS